MLVKFKEITMKPMTFKILSYSALGAVLITAGGFLYKVNKDEKITLKRQMQELKSYNLPEDEFKRLGTRIQDNFQGAKILDSLAQDKEKKQLFEQGKQFVRDSIARAQEKFAAKNYSAKVDTALKSLKK